MVRAQVVEGLRHAGMQPALQAALLTHPELARRVKLHLEALEGPRELLTRSLSSSWLTGKSLASSGDTVTTATISRADE